MLQGLERSVAGLGRRAGTHLGLSVPVEDVREGAPAAELDVLAGADEDVAGGDDVGDGRVAGVVACEPDGDGDVVGGAPERDGEEAVQAEEELGTAVVVRCVRSARHRIATPADTHCTHPT